jgi:hypothetical protein
VRVRGDLGLLLALGPAPSEAADPALEFASSDPRLVRSFEWAKGQALAYAFDAGDPVGAWYEAALPGREAFCMRDVAHQANGAHALGLARHTHNMLRRFAEAIAESRDFCSYWEIDRHNRPAPVDYKSHAEFWYNLPANFDVLDAIYRMYLWTGDVAYVADPAFRNFQDRSVTDYIERWSLDLGRVMKRPRHMNVRGALDPSEKFKFFRGIPTYHETRDEFVVGVDLLAAQQAAYRAYGHLQEQRGEVESARAFFKKAADVRALIHGPWWDERARRFYAHVLQGDRFEGDGAQALLYWDAIEDGERLRAAVDGFEDRIRKGPPASVEGQSHHAEILFRYGVPDLAYTQLLDLTREDRERREYPEVPYSAVGAIVTGLMGITVVGESPLLAAQQGQYVDRVVRTIAGLTPTTAWAELRHLPVRANLVSARHDGVRKSTLTNERGPALLWQATFEGASETLLVNGRPTKATVEKGLLGRATSWARVVVGAGGRVTVALPDSQRRAAATQASTSSSLRGMRFESRR